MIFQKWNQKLRWSDWIFRAVSLDELMRSMDLGVLVECQSFICGFANTLTDNRDRGSSGIRLTEDQHAILSEKVRTFSEMIYIIGAPLTSRFAAELQNALSKGVVEPDGSKVFVQQLFIDVESSASSIRDFCERELGEKLVYILPPGGLKLYDVGELPFGPEVENAFNNSEDVTEAANCLALGRYTASVFHLMRGMERAVAALCSSLGCTNVDKEWGKLLSDMKVKIEAMPKGSLRDQWSESHSLLYHVKQAWRNNTMHPKQTYTESECKAIYDATKAFMIDLAPLVR